MMDILHSNWLIQMLKKAGDTPQARLLSLFDILNDWTEAPGVDVQLEPLSENNASLLKTYLSLEAAKARAALPEMLATQLYVMALSAINEKLQAHNSGALIHAKSAAEALIIAQTKKEFHISRKAAYAVAACFIFALIIAGNMFSYDQPKVEATPQIASAPMQAPFEPIFNAAIASPQNTAALVAQIEKMRSGNCRLLEAIQLPDRYQSIYFKNIVLGQISADANEQILVRELLEKIPCNYTPMLMQKST